jgi:hypothetical protein
MTAAQTVFTNEYATLMYHPDSRIVHHVFHQPIGGEPFRQVLNLGQELLQQNGAHKWLSDDRQNAALPEEDSAWALSDWAARVLASGWKYWAIVVPHSMAGRVDMQKYIDEYLEKGSVRVMVFVDPSEALSWLEKQG